MNAGSPDSDLATAASPITGVHIGRLPLTMAAASLVLTCSLLVPQALRTAHWRSGLAIMRARRSVAAWQPVRSYCSEPFHRVPCRREADEHVVPLGSLHLSAGVVRPHPRRVGAAHASPIRSGLGGVVMKRLMLVPAFVSALVLAAVWTGRAQQPPAGATPARQCTPGCRAISDSHADVSLAPDRPAGNSFSHVKSTCNRARHGPRGAWR